MKLQSVSSCFSREEFFRGFAPEKGDNKMKLQSVSSCFSREEFLGALLLKKGTIKQNYRASARALAHKNSIFLAIAKALVARNFAWALPKQKGTIR